MDALLREAQPEGRGGPPPVSANVQHRNQSRRRERDDWEKVRGRRDRRGCRRVLESVLASAVTHIFGVSHLY
jgi:hypothetical protein